MTEFKNYLEKQIDALEGAPDSGASDLSAYEGERIEITATDSNGIKFITTSEDDPSGIKLWDNGTGGIGISAQGSAGDLSMFATDAATIEGESISLTATGPEGAGITATADDAVAALGAGGANGQVLIGANGTGGIVSIQADASVILGSGVNGVMVNGVDGTVQILANGDGSSVVLAATGSVEIASQNDGVAIGGDVSLNGGATLGSTEVPFVSVLQDVIDALVSMNLLTQASA